MHKRLCCVLLTALLALPQSGLAATEDHKATITGFFAFVSYNDPTKVTFILNVDPLLDASNGPNYFPFDPSIRYAINVDNNQTALAGVSFELQFSPPQIGVVNYPLGFLGALNGIKAPADSPAPVP